jgi:hypothetical protein
VGADADGEPGGARSGDDRGRCAPRGLLSVIGHAVLAFSAKRRLAAPAPSRRETRPEMAHTRPGEDGSCDQRRAAKTRSSPSILWGTEGSNLSSSSGESGANSTPWGEGGVRGAVGLGGGAVAVSGAPQSPQKRLPAATSAMDSKPRSPVRWTAF